MMSGVFEFYANLPTELQSEVVHEMQPEDRCRFKRCSTRCKKEVMASKNLVYELNLVCTPMHIRIVVVYEKFEDCFCKGFILDFRNLAGKFVKQYLNPDFKTLWEIELDSSTDLTRYAIEEFKNTLQYCQRSIKVLRLNESPFSEMLKDFDFGCLKKLRNLEFLKIDGDLEIQQILSKLRRPLKTLIFTGQSEGLETCEQIYKVQENLILWNLNLDYEQFLKLSASYMDIPIGTMTEKDVLKFVRSWQNGTTETEFKACRWYFEGTDFNELEFFKFFGADDGTVVKLKKLTNPGECAVLCNTDDGLLFCRQN